MSIENTIYERLGVKTRQQTEKALTDTVIHYWSCSEKICHRFQPACCSLYFLHSEALEDNSTGGTREGSFSPNEQGCCQSRCVHTSVIFVCKMNHQATANSNSPPLYPQQVTVTGDTLRCNDRKRPADVFIRLQCHFYLREWGTTRYDTAVQSHFSEWSRRHSCCSRRQALSSLFITCNLIEKTIVLKKILGRASRLLPPLAISSLELD